MQPANIHVFMTVTLVAQTLRLLALMYYTADRTTVVWYEHGYCHRLHITNRRVSVQKTRGTAPDRTGDIG